MTCSLGVRSSQSSEGESYVNSELSRNLISARGCLFVTWMFPSPARLWYTWGQIHYRTRISLAYAPPPEYRPWDSYFIGSLGSFSCSLAWAPLMSLVPRSASGLAFLCPYSAKDLSAVAPQASTDWCHIPPQLSWAEPPWVLGLRGENTTLYFGSYFVTWAVNSMACASVSHTVFSDNSCFGFCLWHLSTELGHKSMGPGPGTKISNKYSM